jgi:hypothetical protein
MLKSGLLENTAPKKPCVRIQRSFIHGSKQLEKGKNK